MMTALGISVILVSAVIAESVETLGYVVTGLVILMVTSSFEAVEAEVGLLQIGGKYVVAIASRSFSARSQTLPHQSRTWSPTQKIQLANRCSSVGCFHLFRDCQTCNAVAVAAGVVGCCRNAGASVG